jgi:peptidyl-prolyl cis-trans isomerase A (cyclophilin A)
LAEGDLENKVKPQGTKFYNGLKFHRVIPDFMVQGGCPQGTGTEILDINLTMNFTQV